MLVLSLNERIYRHIFYDQVGAGTILVFQHHRRYKIPRGTPLLGAKTRGGKILQIALYFRNSTG